jgi:hypothetical protein
MACGPVARQRQRNDRVYNSRCLVMALQTSILPRQQLHCNIGMVFSVRPVPRCYKQSKLVERSELVSQLVRELLRLSRRELLL